MKTEKQIHEAISELNKEIRVAIGNYDYDKIIESCHYVMALTWVLEIAKVDNIIKDNTIMEA